jgi:hypothetical protein
MGLREGDFHMGGDRRKSKAWLIAQYGRRMLRRGKYALGHDPVFLPILLRLTPLGISRQITAHTDLIVEGFPRSGNTFTVFALQNAAQNQLQLSSHVHHPSQVKLAVERGIPTVLVVREPIAVLASYLTYGQHGRPADVFKEYYSYHQELVPYADRVLIVDFDEISSDMPAIVDRINQRFSLQIPPFEQSPENIDHVFGEIARQHQLIHPGLDADHVAPRPMTARKELNERNRNDLLDPRLDHLRIHSVSIYEYFSKKASEQRELFRKVEPSRPISAKTKRPLPSGAAPEELFRSNG